MMKLQEWVPKLKGKKILLLGDMVADVYVKGHISRVSREAPVLVLEHRGETIVPGGAANAVHNAAVLGGVVYAVGICGEDKAGEKLKELLQSKGVVVDGLFQDAKRPTITKTRILAGGQATVRQQVVRIDQESKEPLVKETEEALLHYIEKVLPKMDVAVISDYGSQTVSPKLRQRLIALCREQGVPCMVDSRYDIQQFTGVELIKQNEAEAAAALGLESLDEIGAAEAAEQIVEMLQADGILLTQGGDGMTLYVRGQGARHIPVSNRSEVYDVTGAGDTAVVTMMLALAAGADHYSAAKLANYAAGVVVRKHGTATLTADELLQAVKQGELAARKQKEEME
ncbi:bifunctional heptose 7-phosphate kinase/heptose 1-phosphate adenyltransferase [uncultured Anaeromusa sp.]|uniref:bifunctional heptose 7-phosphate kinase/heptose 1-phosphate adenyltransferase n=1 Tax=uncultured Anaeromusa sp. TaxID=673273 RepID=UPI0037479DDB